jgi:hypothetical protein
MGTSPAKRRISVTIDAELLAVIDQFADSRSVAIEEALRLWRIQKIDDQLRHDYQHRSQAAIEAEEQWAELAEQQLDEILETEGL